MRNYILNDRIDDIDVYFATTIFTITPELKLKFKNSEFKIIETGVEHGSITLICNNSKFELSNFKKRQKH